jgi:ferredoxin like protein
MVQSGRELQSAERAVVDTPSSSPADIQSVPIEERLELVRFKVDKTPHIRLNRENCVGCDTTACVYVCPAGLFELLGGEMHFSYEHCFECGTCYVACDRKAIEWEYPRGGWGVSFRAS